MSYVVYDPFKLVSPSLTLQRRFLPRSSSLRRRATGALRPKTRNHHQFSFSLYISPTDNHSHTRSNLSFAIYLCFALVNGKAIRRRTQISSFLFRVHVSGDSVFFAIQSPVH
ncbi:hypothetical protein L6452_42539 [Arctium lappa]|uniref:Uncharacterized protein n=1 Tax=Arctium lappa TaxID=4217 RepID=A0ACB8XIK1_ARCLA|nr:hypothetical protein L6452_42539 [Arctium lappa]